MRRLSFILWQSDIDQPLLDAVGVAAGARAVRLPSWWDDGPTDAAPAGAVAVRRSSGALRAVMEIEIDGPALPESASEPEFGRRLARALGRPLLFSDCHIFPLTYMMAREDGAIVHVVVCDDDAMTLLPEDSADPDHWERDVLFGPDDPLPYPTAAELDARPDPPEHCATFGGACPKWKFRCVSLRG